MLPFRSIVCLVAACLLGLDLSLVHAQVETRRESTPLEEIPATLAALDEVLNRAADEARTVVEREAAEKRLSDSIAQSLRWSLRTAVTSAGTLDVRGALATARIPADNEAVAKAFKDLEVAHATLQSRRTALGTQAQKELRRRTLEALRTATQPTDLAPLEKTSEALHEAWQRKSPGVLSGVGYQSGEIGSVNNVINLLAAFRRLLEAEAAGHAETIRSALSGLRNSTGSDREIAVSAELRERLERVTAPYTAKREAARGALETGLESGQSKEALSKLLITFEEATNALAQMETNERRSEEQRNLAAAYRTLIETQAPAIPEHPDAARNRVREAASTISRLSATGAPRLAAMLERREQEVVAAARKAGEQREAELRTRLRAIEKPADLEALAREVAEWPRAQSHSGVAQEEWRQLGNTLASLAAGWSSGTIAFLQARALDTSPSRGLHSPELAALRARIERDILSRALGVPELTVAPLSEKPPEAALDAVCDTLAARGEWRRLYRLLEARAAIPLRDLRQAPDETLTALRSFIGGQNLEIAEQWADAAEAYKAVLRSTSERAPIQAAAERLKALHREHPDAFSTTAPSAPAKLPR